MRQEARPVFVLVLSLAVGIAAGCDTGGGTEPAGHVVTQAPVQAEAVEAAAEHAHAVRCGCSLEHVGTCGEFVEIEGKFVELVLPEDSELGPMPFCGKDGLAASVEGEMKDGKFVARSFAFVE